MKDDTPYTLGPTTDIFPYNYEIASTENMITVKWFSEDGVLESR